MLEKVIITEVYRFSNLRNTMAIGDTSTHYKENVRLFLEIQSSRFPTKELKFSKSILISNIGQQR